MALDCGQMARRLKTFVACVVALAAGTAARAQYATYTEVTACNGVCTDLSVDPTNCGACGAACSANHLSTVTCSGSPAACGGTCSTGWADCDGNKRTNGCETSLTATTSCGACGAACSTNHMATVYCGGSPAGCYGACSAGWGDCDANKRTNGCETSLSTTANCNACGAACSTNHMATVACGLVATAAWRCYGACSAGWGDCDANQGSNGCETSLTTTTNCGACGAVCSTNHMATVTCGGSPTTCNGTCATGWGDCENGRQFDGCETPLTTNANCGGCGYTCPLGYSCSASGLCVQSTCPGTVCSGKCVDLDSDRYNCGACGRVCPSTRPLCEVGNCVNPNL